MSMMVVKQTSKNVLLPWLWSGLVCLCVVGCDIKSTTALERVKQEGVLHVVTRNSPVSYFEDRNGETGFEYELVERFAKKLGVKLQVETVDTLDDVYAKVADEQQVFIGAAGLVNTERRSEQVTFSSPYLVVDSLVIYRVGATRPASVKDVVGKSILVIKGSSQADRLKLLQQQYPQLTYQESDAVDVIDLLQQIEDKKIDITLINSNELAMTQVYYSNVRVAFSLAKDQQVGWILAKSEDTSLAEAIDSFIDETKQNGILDRLADRFYGHIDTMGYVGAYSFAKHLQERLPKYEKFFVQYGKQYKLDWKLLAAIGYQESHWDPEATSYTGVRGLMMLTQDTAKAMAVENRLDAKQSIMGGTKLLSLLKQAIDEDIADPDRTFFALAAYNMGQGHVMDAQKLATLNKLNAKSWYDVNKVLSLLSQKQWYQQTRYGYARGFETKQFVRNVRRYYDILSWLDLSQREAPVSNEEQLYIPAFSRNELATASTSL